MIKKTDIDYRVDELLVLWHKHTSAYRPGRGYSGKDSTCRDFRAPTHFDWWNGVQDAWLEDQDVNGITAAMERIPDTPQRWHTALSFEAKNLSAGLAVWSSPRLPKSAEEREVLTLEARNKLMRELRSEGML